MNHDLHTRPLFSDEGLVRLLDTYPREKLGVFTMGDDPVDWQSWRRGTAGNLSGDRLLAAAQEGRIWLNLRHTNDYLPQYADLEREIFAETPVRTFKRDLGMLISSANAQVFYHLDVPLVSLWQLRGQKRVWIYPVEAPYVPPAQLERIVLKESAEQFAYEPAWDAGAEVHDLTPGKMAAWVQNAPHRIENGPMLNVSLSIEYMTPAALLRANGLYADGLLRKAGLTPRTGAFALPKLALARGWKAVGLAKSFEKSLPVTFDLETEIPGVLSAAA